MDIVSYWFFDSSLFITQYTHTFSIHFSDKLVRFKTHNKKKKEGAKNELLTAIVYVHLHRKYIHTYIHFWYHFSCDSHFDHLFRFVQFIIVLCRKSVVFFFIFFFLGYFATQIMNFVNEFENEFHEFNPWLAFVVVIFVFLLFSFCLPLHCAISLSLILDRLSPRIQNAKYSFH